MRPALICQRYLGPVKLEVALKQLTSPQVKAVLKRGEIKVKLPAGVVSQQRRRAAWAARISSAIDQGNDEVASEVLQQWLLHHRRAMLIDFLERLGVKHTAGETDVGFLVGKDTEQVRAAAAALLRQYPPDEVAAYLRYVAFQQRASVFDEWEPLQALERPEQH